MGNLKQIDTAVASCGSIVRPGEKEAQLFPDNAFQALDGRPHDVAIWKIDRLSATQVIRRILERKNPLVIDYEHQSLEAGKNGNPAPAAGWFNRLEWREGKGLFAIDIEWTSWAINFISSSEYRYISPVFKYDKKSGVVMELLGAGITNTPAIDGMNVVAATSNMYARTPAATLSKQELSVCKQMGIDPVDFQSAKENESISFGDACRQGGLSQTQLGVCRSLGVKPEEFKRTLNAELNSNR